MDVMGFIFGMSGATFGLLGFMLSINASNDAKSAAGKVEQLQQQLIEAGVLAAPPKEGDR